MKSQIIIWVGAVIVIFSIGYLATDIVYKSVMAGFDENQSGSTLQIKENTGKQSDQFYRPQPAHNINQLTDEAL